MQCENIPISFRTFLDVYSRIIINKYYHYYYYFNAANIYGHWIYNFVYALLNLACLINYGLKRYVYSFKNHNHLLWHFCMLLLSLNGFTVFVFCWFDCCFGFAAVASHSIVLTVQFLIYQNANNDSKQQREIEQLRVEISCLLFLNR